MRREGRQHGMVRTRAVHERLQVAGDFPKPPSPLRPSVHLLSSPPTAGLFTRVPSRPTNHSKFTGKCRSTACGQCRHCPASKSVEKAKGSQKLRRADLLQVEDEEDISYKY